LSAGLLSAAAAALLALALVAEQLGSFAHQLSPQPALVATLIATLVAALMAATVLAMAAALTCTVSIPNV
jgi:hypothetical protein